MNCDELENELSTLRRDLEEVRHQLVEARRHLEDLQEFRDLFYRASEMLQVDLATRRERLTRAAIDDQQVRCFGRYRQSMLHRIEQGRSHVVVQNDDALAVSRKTRAVGDQIDQLTRREAHLVRSVESAQMRLTAIRQLEASHAY